MVQTIQNTEEVISNSHELKLPSADLVTADNLWQSIQAIAVTSNKFTQEQLKSNLKIPTNTIIRILAYLKYLNYLKESREEEMQGGKKIKIQYFFVNKELPSVEAIQYEIKANRKEEAQKKWQEFIRDHELSKIIVKEFFATEKTKTRIDLENFLKARKELAGKQPHYYQHGVSFILKLLGQADVVSSTGNNIYLSGSFKPEEDKPGVVTDTSGQEDRGVPNTGAAKGYKVTIEGPGLDTTIEITEQLDLDIVDKFLQKIRNIFPPAKKEEENENSKPSD